MVQSVPDLRIRPVNDAPVARNRDYVLYWMVANRRLTDNFALDRAVEWARRLGKPLVIFEPLRCGYRWASDRIHRFVLDGMAEHHRRLADHPALYYPYVEQHDGAGKGLLQALARRACAVVTDDFPCFFLPGMVRAAAAVSPVCLEAVDSHGLVPLRAADRLFPTAFSFRRFLHRELPSHLRNRPRRRPLTGRSQKPAPSLPTAITGRWPAASAEVLAGRTLGSLPIDHDVAPTSLRGGTAAGRRTWRRFREDQLADYPNARRDPDRNRTSHLSPYLHFGHVSAHEIFRDLMDARGWEIEDAGKKPTGHREGWWHVDPPEEAFLDQLITWRELCANTATYDRNFDRYGALPEWARRTLEDHADDPREFCYRPADFEQARTHDPLWNAAQTQLREEGRIFNYLRMLWGKNILAWSRSPREALRIMVHLNNKYALDGRDPNSYGGIFWVLGRYDRPWGPERPVFGKVRYMNSRNTIRKLRVDAYVARYATRS
ncbi:MAG: cryptochrome/DNA photolyase family protein [Planctomycetota bacterium]|jgi:deoxyribodipyrimidine photo-lyase